MGGQGGVSFLISLPHYITEAGLEQSRASVGAKAASVARNEEGKGGVGSQACVFVASCSRLFRRMFLLCFCQCIFTYCSSLFGSFSAWFLNPFPIVLTSFVEHKSSIVSPLMLVWLLGSIDVFLTPFYVHALNLQTFKKNCYIGKHDFFNIRDMFAYLF